MRCSWTASRCRALRGVLRHDYPITLGICARAHARRSPTCRRLGLEHVRLAGRDRVVPRPQVPYLLLVESHDSGPKPGWRRRVKETVVPSDRQGRRERARGRLARPRFGAGARRRPRPDPGVREHDRRRALRRAGRRLEPVAARSFAQRFGLGQDDVVVLTVARLAPEKGIDTLSCARRGGRRRCSVVVGDGPERARLERSPASSACARSFAALPWEPVVEAYAAADVFALLSRTSPGAWSSTRRPPAGLPLVLSEPRRRGARPAPRRRERHARTGRRRRCCRRRAAPSRGRSRAAPQHGARSRELAAGLGYEPSVESLVAAVREATARR